MILLQNGRSSTLLLCRNISRKKPVSSLISWVVGSSWQSISISKLDGNCSETFANLSEGPSPIVRTRCIPPGHLCNCPSIESSLQRLRVLYVQPLSNQFAPTTTCNRLPICFILCFTLVRLSHYRVFCFIFNSEGCSLYTGFPAAPKHASCLTKSCDLLVVLQIIHLQVFSWLPSFLCLRNRSLIQYVLSGDPDCNQSTTIVICYLTSCLTVMFMQIYPTFEILSCPCLALKATGVMVNKTCKSFHVSSILENHDNSSLFITFGLWLQQLLSLHICYFYKPTQYRRLKVALRWCENIPSVLVSVPGRLKL